MDAQRRRLVIGLGGLVAVGSVAGGAYLVADGGSSGSGSGERTDPDAAGTGGGLAAVVYRSPTCGCCENYEGYLRDHDFRVESHVQEDVASIKADHSVPEDAQSCHTTVIDGYAVEGHVPVEAITKLLDERPAIDGIAVPGMPQNSPGMGDPDGQPLAVVAFAQNRIEDYLTITR